MGPFQLNFAQCIIKLKVTFKFVQLKYHNPLNREAISELLKTLTCVLKSSVHKLLQTWYG